MHTTTSPAPVVATSTHLGPRGPFLLGHADASCARIAEGTDSPVPAGEDTPWPCASCITVAVVAGPAVSGPSVDAPERGDGPGQGRRSSGPSEAQERYVRSLLGRLNRPAEETISRWTEKGLWTRRNVSELIDDLKADLATAEALLARAGAPAVRPNRYAGRCADCGAEVAAEAGSLTKEGGRWVARHLPGACPEAPPAAPAPATAAQPAQEVELEEGMYRTPDGTIYKVQLAVHGSGRPYAKRLVVLDEGDRYTKTVRGVEVEVRAEFAYAAGAVARLRPEWKMSLAEAQEFGALYGVCCACAATLTDEDSIAAGIGPVCGSKFA